MSFEEMFGGLIAMRIYISGEDNYIKNTISYGIDENYGRCNL